MKDILRDAVIILVTAAATFLLVKLAMDWFSNLPQMVP